MDTRATARLATSCFCPWDHMSWPLPDHPRGENSFVSEDVRHNNPTDLALVWETYGVEPANYDNQIDGPFWQDHFDTTDSPTTRAYKLLHKLDLGPTLSEAGAQPHLIFH
ncbi:hypothetical protein FHT77_004529 [Rhizobium sp. BK181]|nr:hypothetical protein [Rhizobium sp. BK181]